MNNLGGTMSIRKLEIKGIHHLLKWKTGEYEEVFRNVAAAESIIEFTESIHEIDSKLNKEDL